MTDLPLAVAVVNQDGLGARSSGGMEDLWTAGGRKEVFRHWVGGRTSGGEWHWDGHQNWSQASR